MTTLKKKLVWTSFLEYKVTVLNQTGETELAAQQARYDDAFGNRIKAKMLLSEVRKSRREGCIKTFLNTCERLAAA